MPDTKTIVKLARSMGFDPSRWDCEQIAKLYGWLPTHGTIDRAPITGRHRSTHGLATT